MGMETKFITKLLKNLSIKISYNTNNTIVKTLTPRLKYTRTHSRFEKSGVYQLICPDFNMKYVVQTGRLFEYDFKNTF